MNDSFFGSNFELVIPLDRSDAETSRIEFIPKGEGQKYAFNFAKENECLLVYEDTGGNYHPEKYTETHAVQILYFTLTPRTTGQL